VKKIARLDEIVEAPDQKVELDKSVPRKRGIFHDNAFMEVSSHFLAAVRYGIMSRENCCPRSH